MSSYKRKSDRKLVFTEEILKDAKERIRRGQSQRSVAESLNVPESTLRKRLKAGTVPCSLGRFSNVFTPELDSNLAEHCRRLDLCFYGLTKKELGRVAYDLANKNGLNHRFNNDKKEASKKWVENFARRHNFSLRQPEKTSLARAAGFNRVQVQRFYDNLKQVLTTFKFVGRQIFNMDETGLQTVPNKLPKVYAKKGKKIVGKVVSAERGQTVTAVCCMGATGIFVPPALIFPRKRQKPELMDGAPEDSLQLVSDSGYMNSDLFIIWLNHFIKMVKPSKDEPALLILDNHSSHLSLQAIELARDHRVVLLSLAPHTSHRMQSLDTGFFGPLKKAYAVACDNWQVSNPGRAITQYQVARLFGTAYLKVGSIDRAKKSFESCGIWPFNDQIFSDEDFAPANVTDRPNPTAETSSTGEALNSSNLAVELPLTTTETVTQVVSSPIPVNTNISAPVIALSQLGGTETLESTDNHQEVITTPENDEPTPSKSSFLRPEDILPLPKSNIQKKRNIKRKKSEILTSSPYKNQIEAGQKEKEEKAKKTKKTSNKNKSTTPNRPTLLETSTGTEVVRCPLCAEVYVEPPDEDWIQCSQCGAWWHDECSDYLGFGVFKCDVCLG
ncbi:unnamed protein product [Parnassius mnemosyne]|uniref:HTH CENPB-type domain-containing protein n=1 Tax=Parnassius mnemosyne TaxID=213953 RepID=A0AAV1KB73_9NEOP